MGIGERSSKGSISVAKYKHSKVHSGNIVERLPVIVEEQLDKLAKEIETDLKFEAGNSKYGKSTTGREQKIHIEKIHELARFIGTDDLGLYYLNFGNKKGKPIVPNKHKYMKFKGKKGNYAGKTYYAKQVNGYDGINFIKKVADKYR